MTTEKFKIKEQNKLQRKIKFNKIQTNKQIKSTIQKNINVPNCG